MKSCFWLAISTILVMLCWATIAGAETRYITDQLVVSLREQPQQNAQSITYLKTDSPVEVLEEKGEFIKVQTKAGEIGYINQSYLTPATPKAAIITQLQQERDRLADKIKGTQRQLATATSRGDQSQQELAAQLSASQQQVSDLQKALEESQTSLTRTKQAYQALQEDAKDVVATTKERDQLRETNLELSTTVANLKDEVEALTMTGIIKWFLAGAGVLLLGWLVGKFSGRRRARF